MSSVWNTAKKNNNISDQLHEILWPLIDATNKILQFLKQTNLHKLRIKSINYKYIFSNVNNALIII